MVLRARIVQKEGDFDDDDFDPKDFLCDTVGQTDARAKVVTE